MKQVKLLKKLKLLLKKIRCPRYLHYFGPKKYEFVQHAHALLLKEALRCSFRRLTKLLNLLGVDVPTYSALCKSRKRIPLWIWRKLLSLSVNATTPIVAVDGTGFSRTSPSYHYIKRIDRSNPIKRYAKLSALFDIKTKRFMAIKARIKPRHDMQDMKYLLKFIPKETTLLGDTAYDAEWLHEVCYWKKIQTVIKSRKNVKRGWARKKQMKNYSESLYHQRSLVEAGFSSIKRKYGGAVLARKAKGVKVELYCKVICHNLELCVNRFST